LENLGPEVYNPHHKLFNSDSEASLNSESTNPEGVKGKVNKNPVDYASYTKLFEKKPSVDSMLASSSSSFILEDYSSFKKKLSSKKSLHK
jgi:hypothetical protein